MLATVKEIMFEGQYVYDIKIKNNTFLGNNLVGKKVGGKLIAVCIEKSTEF